VGGKEGKKRGGPCEIQQRVCGRMQRENSGEGKERGKIRVGPKGSKFIEGGKGGGGENCIRVAMHLLTR